MSASERRTELYALLAAGLIRLLKHDRDDTSASGGDSSLHFCPEQSGTAGPTQRRSA
jgi:hypothetical protein